MINKLEVVRVLSKCLYVKSYNHKRGCIYIKDISPRYVKDLSKIFTKGDIIYGKFKYEQNDIAYYNLSQGHTSSRNLNVYETGGGSLGLIYMVENLLLKNKLDN